MKGLMIKDLRILLAQKFSLLIYLGVSLFMLLSGMDVSFCIGYATMLMTILMIGTISYDEHENGMSFLMTLPVSRKDYVLSKYCFTVIGVCLIDCAMLLTLAVYEKIQPSGLMFLDYVTIVLIMLAVAMLMISLLLPFNFKFGVEKSRFVLVAIAGVVGVVTVLVSRYSEEMPYGIRRLLEKISLITPEITALIFAVICLLAMILSVLISIRIIEKKDY